MGCMQIQKQQLNWRYLTICKFSLSAGTETEPRGYNGQRFFPNFMKSVCLVHFFAIVITYGMYADTETTIKLKKLNNIGLMTGYNLARRVRKWGVRNVCGVSRGYRRKADLCGVGGVMRSYAELAKLCEVSGVRRSYADLCGLGGVMRSYAKLAELCGVMRS